MSVQDSEGPGPLAILCGGGALPFAVADAVIATGRKAVLFALEGAADADKVNGYAHHWIPWSVGKLIATLRQEGCRDIVLIGSLVRPPLWRVVFDLKALTLLPTVVAALRGGDNHLLSTVARVAEGHGFRIVAAHDVAPNIVIRAGVLTSRHPDDGTRTDIDRALALLSTIGPFDVGQAVVVINHHVVAIEGIEGTDAMLTRISDLRRSGRITTAPGRGVLVKAPKPQQDRRFDLPAIGPGTIASVKAAGLAGIAVVAGETVIAEPDEVARAADDAGLFVVAVETTA